MQLLLLAVLRSWLFTRYTETRLLLDILPLHRLASRCTMSSNARSKRRRANAPVNYAEELIDIDAELDGELEGLDEGAKGAEGLHDSEI